MSEKIVGGAARTARLEIVFRAIVMLETDILRALSLVVVQLNMDRRGRTCLDMIA